MSTTTSHTPPRSNHSTSSNSSSASNSISLIQVDELSSFGATKQNRLPALIKLHPLADSQQQQQQQQRQQQAATSMPGFSASEVEKMAVTASPQAESMPAQVVGAADKENSNMADKQQQQQPKSMDPASEKQRTPNESDDFQVVDMDEEEAAAAGLNADLIGPSLPAPSATAERNSNGTEPAQSANFTSTSFAGEWDAKSLAEQLQSSHLGDSLIEMIINLRNENQNLVRALETNNDYVKERLQEFKRCQEEAKRRETQYALEKAEIEHQARKLRRQNEVLSERLKSLEGKLKEMNAEVGETLDAAHSSKASSVRADNNELYPELGSGESFSNTALASQSQQQPTTMQMDATNSELYHPGDAESSSGSESEEMDGVEQQRQSKAGPSDEEAAKRVGAMSEEELSKHFDATKTQFYALDDPMKQCDQLEKQLNDIGRRDYEICLLQQQLNIYRQDFRLERMAKLEAKMQIEKLKSDIDRLCLERVQEQQRERNASDGVHFGPTTTIPNYHSETGSGAHMIGKLGHHLSKKAVRSAAKAAKYAAKQAHLEEKAAAALARAQAARATAAKLYTTGPRGAETGAPQQPQAAGEAAGSEQQAQQHHHHHRHRGHRRHSDQPPTSERPHRSGRGGIRNEVVSDLLSTANKAMMTGYKMASTHVNLALDKLSQFEQQQAAQLDPLNKPPIQKQMYTGPKGATSAPSAPPMDAPSID